MTLRDVDTVRKRIALAANRPDRFTSYDVNFHARYPTEKQTGNVRFVEVRGGNSELIDNRQTVAPCLAADLTTSSRLRGFDFIGGLVTHF